MKKIFFPLMMLAAATTLPVHAEKDTPLGKEMEAMNDAFKGFRKETDPAKGAATAREAEDHCLKAMAFVPAKLEKETDAAAKAKGLVEYKIQMSKLYATLCEIEGAFLAKDLTKVADLSETMKGEKKEGHGKFIDKDE